jgi:hypothetical protein
MLAAMFLFALAGAAPAAAPPQSAEIHHCIAADGDLLYTDKACAALGARDLADDDGSGRGPFMPAYRSGCIRSLREFAYELSSAIEVGDVNRLAALYRWNGTSTRAGYEVMNRLEEIAGRPLLTVEPVYPAPPAASTSDPLPFDPAPQGPPVALRLDQTLANGVTPAPTTLRLAHESGCWWVSL